MAGSAAVGIALVRQLMLVGLAALTLGMDSRDGAIRLELSPRVCTLSGNDKECSALVHAQWRSTRDESLCLVILGRTDVKRCWEHFSQGTYSIDLVFNEDVTFELRDPALESVLASEAVRVIREALHYRHPRREPWNIFE